MTDMWTEINQQPEVVAGPAAAGLDAYRDLRATARASGVAFVLYVARGTSDNAAVYGQYLAATSAGLPSGLALPSAVTLYRQPIDFRRCLVIGVSQSGETPDVAESLAYARSHGAFTVAITNNAGSPLAVAADRVLTTKAGVERSVAATKTYTSQLAVLALFWAAWTDDEVAAEALRGDVPRAMRAGLAAEAQIAALADELKGSSGLLVVARAYNLATSLETALKLQETAAIPALPYSVVDLMHGPIAMLQAGLPVLCFAPTGPAQASVLQVSVLLRERGARGILVAPPGAAPAHASPVMTAGQPDAALDWIRLEDVPESFSPLVAIIPAQLFACRLALVRGRDPDHPFGLAKVTPTR